MKERYKPRSLIIFFSAAAVILSSITSLVGICESIVILNESQILYLFSTSAQVIAGVYGLTLTGFIFFRNELSREESEDETLRDAVESLKERYYVLLVFITILVLLTLALANVVISAQSSVDRIFNVLLVNSGQSAFAVSLVAIAYFVFDIASPRRIEVASRALQAIFDPGHADPDRGSLEEFLRNYNRIEALLTDAGITFSLNLASYSSKPGRRLSNTRLAEILARNGRISKSLYEKVRDLITLRNSIIHGADPVVSGEVVERSRLVLEDLRKALAAES